jgi:hypothetical protein
MAAKLRVWMHIGGLARCPAGPGHGDRTYPRNYMGPALGVPVGARKALGPSGAGPDPSHELSDLVVNCTLVTHLAADLFPTV